MTEYILTSTDDNGHVAKALGAGFIKKPAPLQRFEGLGRAYRNNRVYVVDDSPLAAGTFLEMMCRSANDAGTPEPRFSYFEDPRKALEQFASEMPDLVIAELDMNKYRMGGDELILKMKEIEKKGNDRKASAA